MATPGYKGGGKVLFILVAWMPAESWCLLLRRNGVGIDLGDQFTICHRRWRCIYVGRATACTGDYYGDLESICPQSCTLYITRSFSFLKRSQKSGFLHEIHWFLNIANWSKYFEKQCGPNKSHVCQECRLTVCFLWSKIISVLDLFSIRQQLLTEDYNM